MLPVRSKRMPAGNRQVEFRRVSRLLDRQPPSAIRDWLEDPGSVTSRMRGACRGEFSLSVVGQKKARPFRQEARVLQLPPRRFALIRQVLLCCAGTPWIFARSVLPFSTLKGCNRRLAHLGSKPLGEVLFALPGLARRQVQIERLSVNSTMRQALIEAVDEDPADAWLRRSVFLLNNDPLLINEVFLSNIRYE